MASRIFNSEDISKNKKHGEISVLNTKIEVYERRKVELYNELKKIEQCIKTAKENIWDLCSHKWYRISFDDDLDKYRCEYCNLPGRKEFIK